MVNVYKSQTLTSLPFRLCQVLLLYFCSWDSDFTVELRINVLPTAIPLLPSGVSPYSSLGYSIKKVPTLTVPVVRCSQAINDGAT